MDKADVAVVLPVYNGGSQVRQALDCLLNQTVRPAEIIAVDDGSSDETPEILSEYEHEHETIRVLTHETNQGLPTALNTAIEATDRTYIARHDVDDRSVPNRIETQYKYMMAHPTVDIVGTATDVIDDQGNIRGTICPPSDPSSVLAGRNPFVHGSVMMRRKAIEDVDGYDPLFENSQDYDLWIRLHRGGYTLGSMQTVLYKLKRPEGHLSIEQRQRRILYGLVARAEINQKEKYRSVIQNADVMDIHKYLPRQEKAVYNQQSAEICIKHNCWARAIREAAPAIANDPSSIRTYATLGLSLLPPPLSRRILEAFQIF